MKSFLYTLVHPDGSDEYKISLILIHLRRRHSIRKEQFLILFYFIVYQYVVIPYDGMMLHVYGEGR